MRQGESCRITFMDLLARLSFVACASAAIGCSASPPQVSSNQEGGGGASLSEALPLDTTDSGFPGLGTSEAAEDASVEHGLLEPAGSGGVSGRAELVDASVQDSSAPECVYDQDCPVQSECEVPRCDGAGTCRVTAKPSGEPCGEGLTACSAQDTCDGSGVCQPNHRAAGEPLEDPAGNCLGLQCDGNGSSEVVPLDVDVPRDDGTGCTFPGCLDGMIVPLPRAEGFPCGEVASDCSGQDTCNGQGECQSNHFPSGMVLPTQGVCLARRCDGAGNVTVTPSNALCDDGLFCNGPERCREDGSCAPGPFPCSARVLTDCSSACNEAADQCNANNPVRTPCGANVFCDGQGACVECVSDDDCPGIDDGCVSSRCQCVTICGPI